MKIGFLLLPLFLAVLASSPPTVRVSLSSLTKAAYLAAKKGCIETKPRILFPLKKKGGRLTVPTAKGERVFADKHVGTDDDDQAKYDYAGYLPDMATHVIVAHLWERTNYILLEQSGREIVMYDEPIYAPDGRSFVSASSGLEYSVYPNTIRLFRYGASGWREMWHTEPTTWEPEDICWTSTTTLVVRKQIWTDNNPGNTYTHSKITISSAQQR